MSPGEVAEGFGWGPLVALTIAIATSLLGYGASNQRSGRTAKDVADLKKEHSDAIEKVRTAADAAVDKARASADAATTALANYKLEALDKFERKGEIAQVEGRLGARIDGLKREVFDKVDEIKVEFGRKSIEHTIKNAIAAGLAQAHLANRGKVPE